MRIHYITRDNPPSEAKGVYGSEYEAWSVMPVLSETGLWWVGEPMQEGMEHKEISPAKAKQMIGRYLKRGQIWCKGSHAIQEGVINDGRSI